MMHYISKNLEEVQYVSNEPMRQSLTGRSQTFNGEEMVAEQP